MNVPLFAALAFPLGCLALVCGLALIGILMLAGALRGIGAIKCERVAKRAAVWEGSGPGT